VQCLPDAVDAVALCSWGWVVTTPETCRAVIRLNKKTLWLVQLVVITHQIITMHGPINVKFQLCLKVRVSVWIVLFLGCAQRLAVNKTLTDISFHQIQLSKLLPTLWPEDGDIQFPKQSVVLFRILEDMWSKTKYKITLVSLQRFKIQK
jgi:hypothetical protein